MDIIDKFIKYQIDFVEQKSPWSKFKVCPYAKKARLDNKILYVVKDFTDLDIEPIKEFANSDYLVMVYINPNFMDFASLEALVDKITPKLKEIKVEVFTGHPDHPLRVNGFYVRRSLPWLAPQWSSCWSPQSKTGE